MGVEMAALAATAIAAGAQAYNTQKTERKQDRSLAESIRNQSQKQQKADSEVAQLVNQQAQSSPDQHRQQAEQQYLDQARRASPNAAPGFNQAGRVSDAFSDRAEAAAAGLQQYGGERSNLMARQDAPGMQRFAEGAAMNDSRVNLNMISRDAQGQAFLDSLRTRAIRRNPWIDAGAAALQGYAGTMGGGSTGAMTGANSAFGPYASGYQFPGGA